MLGGRRRILFAMAMPGQLFHADRKARILRQKLSPLLEQGLASLDIEPAVRADQLQRILRSRQPDVLHIVCHGGTREKDGRPVLVLEDRRGHRDLVDAEELAQVVEQAGIRPELVALEACGSASIAEALAARDGIGATVGITKDIEVEASTRFFVSLLQALAWGSPVHAAFSDARRDLELLAPSIWSLPVLFPRLALRSEDAGAEPFTLTASLGIDPTRAEEHVSLAEPLRPASPCFGREAELRRLDRAWLHGERRIVHLHGPAGTGKTALLAHWLELQAQRRWPGATRVFTWSFDPLAEGQGCGSLATFVDRAQDFFGAIDPVLMPERSDADDTGGWLDGLRLGRAIRHERALLCLDAVPLLPHVEASVHGPLELLPPVIAALLQELGRSGHALCVLTTRSAGELKMEGVDDVPVGTLDEAPAASLLAHRGVVARTEELRQRARELRRHPATLATMADLARGLGTPGAAAPADVPSVIEGLADARRLLAGLAHGGGSLSFDELRTLEGLPDASELVPVWDDFGEALLHAIRRVCAVGIARPTDRCGVVLCQSATLEHLPQSKEACAALEARARRNLQEPLVGVSDIPAYFDAVHLALQRCPEGAEAAVRLYVDHVCQRTQLDRNTSYIVRKHGAIADDLWFLAEFFEPAPDGSFRGEELRPGVAEADPPQGAFFHHRLGLGLRHLGRLREAVAPLRRAYQLHAAAGGRFEERAATCANDVAETLAWQDDLGGALEWASLAVERADVALAYAATVADGPEKLEAERLAQLTQYLCRATLGHVHDRRGEHDAAATCFESANHWVRIRQSNGHELYRRLLSRPGYQYWCFLLARIERRLAAATPDEARTAWVEAEIAELMAHLDAARHWCEKNGIARVTRAYHELVKGRLLLLVDQRGLRRVLPQADQKAPSLLEQAQRDLFYATHVLRAHQHLWMLPEVLDARVSLFRHMGEPELAELDRREADELRAAIRGPA